MTSKKDFIYNPPPRQLVPNRSHLHFPTHQATIQRTASLKKVDSTQPTFTPVIHDLPFQIYPDRTKTEVSKQQIRERLIDNQREKAESLRAEKIRREDNDWAEYCTFQPSINIESKRIASKQTINKQAHERLYQEAISKIKSLQGCTYLLTESDKQNCTFQPNVKREHSSQEKSLAPIYQRLHQIISDKKEYLKRLQNEKYQSQAREKPQINLKTRQIVESKADFKKNVLDRLFSYMRDKNDKLEQMAEAKQQLIEKQCTFKPEINYHSQSVSDGDFLERQQREADKARYKLQYLQEIGQESFQPSINKLSSLLIEAERADETEAQKLQRLHFQPLLERKAELEKIQQQCFKECTFQPEINPISKGLKGAPQHHRCACHPKEEHYHFHPQINPKSRQLAQKPRAKDKEQMPAVQVARLQLQYREMKECTFRPKTLGDRFRSASQKTSIKDVRGAQSYQLRIEKVKARKKQQQQLKQKLFEIDKRYVERRQTKTEPFKLSAGTNKISQLKQKVEQEFRRQCTFKPEKIGRVR